MTNVLNGFSRAGTLKQPKTNEPATRASDSQSRNEPYTRQKAFIEIIHFASKVHTRLITISYLRQPHQERQVRNLAHTYLLRAQA